jgi:hypothetical protein
VLFHSRAVGDEIGLEALFDLLKLREFALKCFRVFEALSGDLLQLFVL